MVRNMNRRILITGASGGIGIKLAEQLLKEGDIVYACARTLSKLSYLKESFGDRCVLLYSDFKSEQSTLAFIEEIDDINFDVVIFCAGFAYYQSLVSMTPQTMNEMMFVNYQSVVYIIKSMVDKQHNPHFIILGSLAAIASTPGGAIYSASKAALNQTINALRLEMPEATFTVVNTGPVDTEFIFKASGNISRLNRLIMIRSDMLAQEIIKAIHHPRTEINLPKWMYIALKMYNLAPRSIERVFKPFFMTKVK
ncbi:SDR family NAD(P)-dependent oxidoreductase [Macrococcoides canis]|nr:SDR family NAD(P)-dependent oxidoreductase [Macrococcus canis]